MNVVLNPKITILGIETSCDDTSIAIVQDGAVLVNLITSQWIHKKYGGVVPEYASRFHVESIIELYEMAIQKVGLRPEDINAVAVTRGPGLLGSLMVGLSFAKSVCLSLNIPLIEINHLHAHATSLFIDQKANYPLLCLTVSGGHTQLLFFKDESEFDVIGQTLDDAAGEAFDKTGKLLGLKYPAGPEMDKLAKQGIPKFKFPMAQVPKYNYRFSGLKTAVLYFLQDQQRMDPLFIERNLTDLCASIQHVIVKMLLQKLNIAAIDYKARSIGIAGGVSANSELRANISELCDKNNWNIYLPSISYCTDNAAMIAYLGYLKYLKKDFADLSITALARYPLTQTQ
ncbi:MAG: tRNA (adenosine(37)-N6)-threonylcarbamoyltransferase complex transferase subunit TsaD [Saprospiraceae bacterium]|nr:tRNA (adenosine(37)-N6)-threonylcarbamoyltransferase complex transferase subunit TsaD [Saprospiraceae bacterium]